MKPANQIDGLEIKLRQLAAKVERQRVQHEATVTENENLKRELDRQLGVVSALKDKLAQTQQPVAAGKAPADNDDQREAIQFCLREIDRCLDWLHRN
ncbi:regulator of replication initiation timing [Lewinella marina]|uniref:Uncharacterized protein n=1 Tax=Neolewinella marina TaxID=438751 RepID=A0A2G0CDU8_9BACT|nr:hypothetical protein [Neolewinella marina]NJB85888.1 regulator of replication initiation timing [Neolewinella marina]PHK98135.1 hypothetical protein CGL56_13175 [Neolewinella marina]